MSIADLLAPAIGAILALRGACPALVSAAKPGPGDCPCCADPECASKRVLHNTYACSGCGRVWTDDWCCACDDDCPDCGASESPASSIDGAEEECG